MDVCVVYVVYMCVCVDGCLHMCASTGCSSEAILVSHNVCGKDERHRK